MGKTTKDAPKYFEHIRLPVAPPGKAMPTERDYNRKRDKRVVIHKEDDYDD